MHGGPASPWEGSQVVFAAGSLTQLSKPFNKILTGKGMEPGRRPVQVSLWENLWGSRAD